jgi:hypothetical protein
VSEPSADEPIGTSRLDVAVDAPVDAARAAHVLGPGRGDWLGEPLEEATTASGTTRHLLDLQLRVSEALPQVEFHKAAFVDVGPLVVEGGTARMEISWRAAGLTPLFPVFAGTLTWTDGRLLLDGHYAPPLGTVGAVADRLLLNVAARGTGKRLLERIAVAMATDA